MVVFPNIKINLGLNVLSKRDDGYHNLQSIFYPVNWCDILEIVPTDRFHFELTGIPVPGNQSENLVIKAYHLLQKDFSLSPVSIYLHKVIPTGSGLGAGSSDASATLTCLNQLFKLNLSEKQLLKYAEAIGSDCPFFILNEPCFVSGRGENLQKSSLNLSGFWIKILHSGLQISTKEAFSGITPKKSTINLLSVNNLQKSDFSKCFINDFEINIVQKYPQLLQLKNSLLNEGAFYASMSGSGSAFFGLFDHEPKKTGVEKFEFITQL